MPVLGAQLVALLSCVDNAVPMGSGSRKSRFRVLETDAELELAPLALREGIELTLLLRGLCIESAGAILLFGGVSSHLHGNTAWIGLWLVLGGILLFLLMFWLLQPHKAAKHAVHRMRHHARRLQPRRAPAARPMTEAQFEALEDAVDHSAAESPSGEGVAAPGARGA
jgi:hypothetical protein